MIFDCKQQISLHFSYQCHEFPSVSSSCYTTAFYHQCHHDYFHRNFRIQVKAIPGRGNRQYNCKFKRTLHHSSTDGRQDIDGWFVKCSSLSWVDSPVGVHRVRFYKIMKELSSYRITAIFSSINDVTERMYFEPHMSVESLSTLVLSLYKINYINCVLVINYYLVWIITNTKASLFLIYLTLGTWLCRYQALSEKKWAEGWSGKWRKRRRWRSSRGNGICSSQTPQVYWSQPRPGVMTAL